MNKEEKEKIKNTLEEKRDHLKHFLDAVSNAQDVAPKVQQNLDITNWEIDTIEHFPEEVIELLPDGLSKHIEDDLQYAIYAIPSMPRYNFRAITDSTSVTTSGTLSIYASVVEASKLNRPEIVSFSQKCLSSYREIQEKQDRISEIKQLLARFHKGQLLKRFEEASEAYESVRAGTLTRKAAAIVIRNLLDGLKGNLWELARTKNDQKMKWHVMAERLSKRGSEGTECSELKAQESIRTTIYNDLSRIAKDYEGTDSINLDDIWAQTLDHFYTVLGLITLK